MADPVARPAPVSRPGSRQRETFAQRAARQADENATRRAEAEARSKQAAADSEARKVEAQAKAAAAHAETEANRLRAEAETQRIKFDAEAAKRRADAEESARQAAEARAPSERRYQLGINIGAPVAGYVVGQRFAKNLGAKHAKGIEAANKQLKALGTQITKTIPTKGTPKPQTVAKLAGMVAAADKLRLAARPNALGLATAGIILAEGAFARFVLAPQAGDNKIAREVLGAVGTASIFAATTMVGKRILSNATTAALPNAKAVAAVEAARRMLPAAAPAPAAAPVTAAAKPVTMLQRAAKAVPTSKAAAVTLAAAGAASIAAAVSGRAEAAPTAAAPATGSNLMKAADVVLSSAASAQAARLIANPALRASAGLLTKLAVPLAMISAGIGAAQGYSKTGTVKGALEGAADAATGGGYSYVRNMVAKFAATPPTAATAPDIAARSVGFMREAAARTATEMGHATVLGRSPAMQPVSDGQTAAYTRMQNGRSVFVRGYATPTGAR